MKKMLLTVTILLSIILVSCSSNKEQQTLIDLGLEGMTGKEILTAIANNTIGTNNFDLSVYDDELIVITEDNRFSIDMPIDEFYFSVAPYIDFTHECLYHSATRCQGEMINEVVNVTFVDEFGNVLIDENYTTLDNGFIDLWLPRNIEGILTITYNNLSSQKLISTESEQPTCETTMRLQS